MTLDLTHSTDWFLEKLTRRGDSLSAYVVDTQRRDGCEGRSFLVMFPYMVSYQVIREACVGLECYDHERQILKEVQNSSYLMLVDDCGACGYKHFRLQTANYTIDVITADVPRIQVVSEQSIG